jgi:transposase-like protein
VLLKAMAKKITWWAAAEILGVTDRTMRRWREKLEKDGYAGLADRRKGKPSAQRIPLATVEEVLRLYKAYYDLNIRHFHEKLKEEHDRVELHVGAESPAGSRPGGQAAQARAAPAEAAAPADGGDAVAHRRQQAPMVQRRALV